MVALGPVFLPTTVHSPAAEAAGSRTVSACGTVAGDDCSAVARTAEAVSGRNCKVALRTTEAVSSRGRVCVPFDVGLPTMAALVVEHEAVALEQSAADVSESSGCTRVQALLSCSVKSLSPDGIHCCTKYEMLDCEQEPVAMVNTVRPVHVCGIFCLRVQLVCMTCADPSSNVCSNLQSARN